MGKASKAKKHRNKLGNASAPTITYQGKEVDTNSLHSDLESIYENKRRDGCELLMGIISSCSGDVVVKLASAPLLNILSLRLLDTSAVVRGYAAQIISSMAVCKNSSVANTIVSSGCYHAMLTLFAEQSRGVSSGDADTSFLEALLEALSNIGAASEAAIAMAAEQNFLTLLIEQLHHYLQHGPIALSTSISLLLYTYTDTPLPIIQHLSVPLLALSGTLGSIPLTPVAIPAYLYIIGSCINLFNGEAVTAVTISTLFLPLHTYMTSNQELWSTVASVAASMEDLPAEIATAVTTMELYLEITSNLFVAIKQNEKGATASGDSSSDEDESALPQMSCPLRAALPPTLDIYSFPQHLLVAVETLASTITEERSELKPAGVAVVTLTEHVAITITNSLYIKRDLEDGPALKLLSVFLSLYSHLHTLFLSYDTIPLRSAAIASATTLAALHRVGLWNKYRIENQVANQRIAVIVMSISSFPWVEVPQALCDVLSLLVANNAITATQIQEITLTLLLRLSNPSCLTLSPNCQYEGSLLLMECLLNVIIDLHSGDEMEIYQIYQQLQVNQHLATSLKNFNSKIKKEGKMLHRRDLVRCKETAENLAMFIEYKAAAPK